MFRESDANLPKRRQGAERGGYEFDESDVGKKTRRGAYSVLGNAVVMQAGSSFLIDENLRIGRCYPFQVLRLFKCCAFSSAAPFQATVKWVAWHARR